MKKHLLRIIFVFLGLIPVTGLPCTTFVLDSGGQPVYGKNMDWTSYGPCYVIVNKRGVAKTSMAISAEPDAHTISWTSTFGSVTFNWYYGREFPFEGINEAGLFVSTMGLAEDTEYPLPDSRPPLHAFQWVQYQLDNFSTVDEVIATDQYMRQQGSYGCHFLVGDSTGKCAIIEWLDGKMVCHTEESMPYKVLANSTYDQSVDFLKKYWGFGGFLPIPHPFFYRSSLLRFAIAADMVKKYSPQRSGSAVNYAFRILQNVEVTTVGKSAVWSAVYDSANKRIYFRTWDNTAIRHFDISAFDFSCPSPVQALDITAGLSGDISGSFVDYAREIDLEMLEGWEPPLSDEEVDFYSTYPETTICTEE